MQDVLIDKKFKDDIKVIPVATLPEVIKHALDGPGKDELLRKLLEMKPLEITGPVESTGKTRDQQQKTQETPRTSTES